MYEFDLPQHHKSIIKVIGVGGGGSNAVNHMFNQGIRDVEFVVCNTDAQALHTSPVTNKLQIGINLTSGLGAGANPEKGRNAALESRDEIRELLGSDTKMVFITAGMGGGTGTGAAPVIAEIAKGMDILTVGIVTIPFSFEGKKKMAQAEAGLQELKESCDTVLIILNDKLRMIYGNLSISEAFNQADNVLTTAAKGIAEIITVPGYVNVDFEDVKTVMKDSGSAVMGSAVTTGENRASRAAELAINSPLLNNKNIHGAQKILLSIISGDNAELQMDELTEITDFMQETAGDEAEVIFGHGVDPELGESIRVTIIATGFDQGDGFTPPKREAKPLVRRFDLESNQQIGLWEEKAKPEVETPRFVEEQEEEIEDREFIADWSPKISHDDEDEPTTEKTFEEERREMSLQLGLDEEFEIIDDVNNTSEEDEDPALEELEGAAHPPSKKLALMEAARERVRRLQGLSNTEPTSENNLKEKLEVPAYQRKKVNLQKVPHSSEPNVSRFHLNENNELLGNNKFLHDNVD
ncbi:MAG: cell division protein FtsZ [Bacteroidota bacterium]